MVRMAPPGTGALARTGDLPAPGAGSPPDALDVARAAAGDAEAFQRLYHRYVARIHGLVRRMLDGEDAEEVTQDVFVRVWQKLSTFRGESQFGTWLHRVAVSVILGRRKQYARERSRFLPEETMTDPLVAPSARPGRAMDLEAGIASLPPGARQILLLHDVEGYRHEEIAELLGISSGTSKSQLHRARMALRSYLDA